MKLFLLRRPEAGGYDTFAGFIVAAEDAEAARRIHPHGHNWDDGLERWMWTSNKPYDDWAWIPATEVIVTELGIANAGVKPGIILTDFHAG